MSRLAGKVALITGGAAGIGAACARLLAAEGAAVAITDLDIAAGEALAAELGAQGAQALFLPQDVTDEAAWPGVVATVERHFGRLTTLVANAGIAVMVPVLEMSLADWRRQVAVNLDGVFLTAKHGIPALRRAGGGSVVLMSSVAGLRGSAGLAGYSATKGAVRLFAKSLALECAGAQDNVRVNSVHPGIIETAIWSKMPREANEPVDSRAIAEGSVPLRRQGQPLDVARAVLWLASDESDYVTGTEVVVDGGMTAGRAGGMPRGGG